MEDEVIRNNHEDTFSDTESDEFSDSSESSDSFESSVEEEDFGVVTTPFDPNLIEIDTKQPTVSNVVAGIENGEIDLRPAFQRGEDLWSKGKQSRLIESLLLRIPLPAFYFDVETVHDSNGVARRIWHVIDGLQRLCAIRHFCVEEEDDGGRPRKLVGLEFLKDLEGKTFRALPRPYRRIVEETQIVAYLVKPETPANVKYNIFKRVNTGGVPLSQQEIRHALNQGVPADFLKELAESEHFRIATGGRIDCKRMLDREFANRFLAFYLLDWSKCRDLDSFLDLALKKVRELSSQKRVEVREVFYESLDLIHLLLGENAFYKQNVTVAVKKINRVLFEVLTVSIAKLSSEARNQLTLIDPSVAFEGFKALFNSGSVFPDIISKATGNKERIAARYEIVEDFFKGLLKNV